MKKFIAVILTILFSIPFGFSVLLSLSHKLIVGTHAGTVGLLMSAVISITVVVSWGLFRTLMGKKNDSALYILLVLITLGLAYVGILNFKVQSPISSLLDILVVITVGAITFFSIYNRKRSL